MASWWNALSAPRCAARTDMTSPRTAAEPASGHPRTTSLARPQTLVTADDLRRLGAPHLSRRPRGHVSAAVQPSVVVEQQKVARLHRALVDFVAGGVYRRRQVSGELVRR